MSAIAAPRKSRWNRITTLLLLLGAAVVVLLAWQLWRALALERAARAVEVDRAKLAAERILKQAMGERQVFELLPAAQRFTVGPDGVEADEEVGWLQEKPAADDADLVVQDRLDRAARAEFVTVDAVAASREYDELLAGPLLPVQRLRVLAAAAWQARRAGDSKRRERFAVELEQKIGAMPPVEFGREVVALATASLLRLRAAGGDARPAWALSVAPKLPPGIAAAMLAETGAEVGPDEVSQLHRRVVQRRSLLVAADVMWQDPPVGRSRARDHAGFEHGLGFVPATAAQVLWYFPRDATHWDAGLVS